MICRLRSTGGTGSKVCPGIGHLLLPSLHAPASGALEEVLADNA